MPAASLAPPSGAPRTTCHSHGRGDVLHPGLAAGRRASHFQTGLPALGRAPVPQPPHPPPTQPARCRNPHAPAVLHPLRLPLRCLYGTEPPQAGGRRGWPRQARAGARDWCKWCCTARMCLRLNVNLDLVQWRRPLGGVAGVSWSCRQAPVRHTHTHTLRCLAVAVGSGAAGWRGSRQQRTRWQEPPKAKHLPLPAPRRKGCATMLGCPTHSTACIRLPHTRPPSPLPGPASLDSPLLPSPLLPSDGQGADGAHPPQVCHQVHHGWVRGRSAWGGEGGGRAHALAHAAGCLARRPVAAAVVP